MAESKCLGIHYARDALTAVMLERQGDKSTITDCWQLPFSSEEQLGLNEFVSELSGQIRERYPNKVSATALSLGGRLYQTVQHHSDFVETRQIMQTLRYDIEVEFATDADAIAVSFQKLPNGGNVEDGCDLIVHTARRDELTSLLEGFEAAGVDALIAEADLSSWMHWLKDEGVLRESESCLYLAWTAETLYLLAVDDKCNPLLARSYVCPSVEQASEVLGSELKRSLIMLGEESQPGKVYYHSENFIPDLCKLVQEAVGVTPAELSETNVRKAFAAGVAIGYLNGGEVADFRLDGLEPHSMVESRKRGYYGLSAAIILFFLALSFVMQLNENRFVKVQNQVDSEIIQAWQDTHPGQKMPRNQSAGQLTRDINNLYANLRKQKLQQESQVVSGSASRTFMVALDALNSLPEKFDLQIDTLRTQAEVVNISGSVPELADQIALEAALKRHESITIENWDFTQSGSGNRNDPTSRRQFNMAMKVAQESKTANQDKDENE